MIATVLTMLDNSLILSVANCVISIREGMAKQRPVALREAKHKDLYTLTLSAASEQGHSI